MKFFIHLALMLAISAVISWASKDLVSPDVDTGLSEYITGRALGLTLFPLLLVAIPTFVYALWTKKAVIHFYRYAWITWTVFVTLGLIEPLFKH